MWANRTRSADYSSECEHAHPVGGLFDCVSIRGIADYDLRHRVPAQRRWLKRVKQPDAALFGKYAVARDQFVALACDPDLKGVDLWLCGLKQELGRVGQFVCERAGSCDILGHPWQLLLKPGKRGDCLWVGRDQFAAKPRLPRSQRVEELLGSCDERAADPSQAFVE